MDMGPTMGEYLYVPLKLSSNTPTIESCHHNDLIWKWKDSDDSARILQRLLYTQMTKHYNV